MKTTLKNVEAAMEKTIAKETGMAVEVTSRGVNEWTISGPAVAVDRAVRFLSKYNLMTETGRVCDEELNEVFVYMVSAK